MSNVSMNYMDFDNLDDYDGRIKSFITSADAVAYKTILTSADGNYVYFYKKENAVLADTPDYSLKIYHPSVQGTTLIL